MEMRKAAKFVAVMLPFTVFTLVAVRGILVLPTVTGVKESVVEGTCRQPHIELSNSARPYTGWLVVDKQLCILVEIFYQSFQPLGLRFTQHLLWGLPSLIMVTLLEGARRDRPWYFNSLFLGILYQLWTIGLALSILWAPFVILSLRGASKAPVPRRDAEGALVALLVGYYIPTAVMFTTQSAIATALWQPFPVYIATVQYLWSKIRSTGSHSPPVVGVQAALVVTILTASAVQFYTLYPNLSSLTVSSVWEWLPIWSMPSQAAFVMPRDEAVRGLLQYDAFTAYCSTVAAGLFMMDSIGNALLWLAFAPIGILLLSPSGFIAAMWIQRERMLIVKKSE